MSMTKFQAARELIAEKEFNAARAVLETMPDEPKAKEWLGKLPRKKRRIFRNAFILGVTFFLGLLLGILPSGGARVNATLTARAGGQVVAQSTARPSLTITPTPTTNSQQLTQVWQDGEATRAALNNIAQATNLALTVIARPPPTAAPVVFEGSTGQVVGPITLSRGLWQARVVTAGYFIAQLQVTEGECGTGSVILLPVVFNLMSGDAQPEAEATIRSEGCTTYIELSNITDAWRLEVTQLN